MNRASALLLAILLGAATAPVLAGPPLIAGLSHEQSEDRKNFIEQVRKARKGDTAAQWQVGSTYVALGDSARGLPMLQAAVAAGHPRAAALLGSLHEEGRGIARNLEQARHWYSLAAGHGLSGAMVGLGRLSLQEGTAAARAAAWEWFHQAALLENPEGQYFLGWMLVAGHGPAAARPGQDEQAFQWFVKAAAQGHPGAQVAAATHLLAGKGVARDRKAAAAWLERAAATQDPVANHLLGRLYQEAGAGHRDQARSAYRIAAVAGHREAKFALAEMLAASPAGPDRKQAADWFAKAHQAGHKAAANRLGELYRDGIGVSQQFDKAKTYFMHAATHNDANAMYNLAQMENDGLGAPRDTRQALQWYGRAAEQGHEGAAMVMESLLNSSVKASALGLKGFWQ